MFSQEPFYSKPLTVAARTVCSLAVEMLCHWRVIFILAFFPILLWLGLADSSSLFVSWKDLIVWDRLRFQHSRALWFYSLIKTTVGNYKPWQTWERTSHTSKQRSYRAQRADEAPSVTLVCVERPRTTTDSWIPVLCRATERPLSRHKSADLRPGLTTVSSWQEKKIFCVF